MVKNYAIIGYGNLGREIERQLIQAKKRGMVFSRRGIACNSLFPSFNYSSFCQLSSDFDCAFLCVGSADDAMEINPEICAKVSTVDCFDNHEQMAKYFKIMTTAARQGENTAIVGCGWDPGLLSISRTLLAPFACPSTFWGEGLSLGHTNAVKGISGVEDALCYTLPREEAYERARAGEKVDSKEGHKRQVFVCCKDDCDRLFVAKAILDHPYFVGYETEITFVERGFLKQRKDKSFHRGKVLCGNEEYYLEHTISLKNNAALTAKIMLSYGYKIDKLERGKAYTLPCLPSNFLLNNGETMRYV